VFGVIIDGFPVRNMISSVATSMQDGIPDVPTQDVLVDVAYCVDTWP
jgi:hypothetical protein